MESAVNEAKEFPATTVVLPLVGATVMVTPPALAAHAPAPLRTELLTTSDAPGSVALPGLAIVRLVLTQLSVGVTGLTVTVTGVAVAPPPVKDRVAVVTTVIVADAV